ncbi:hypothetical protein PEC302107_06080 [Pectobacterium araliae]|uniref:ABC transmembrane type-1 domain-containing protein n=1 Tax=Pectobacterium araliae TaxID=3073862 RepID=A0AAN0KAM8_9GAMM|nr:hypothetical protein PEC302110_07020 [Pectobacterium sp. MAFF 302110]GKW18879.1 hypothetical protein PEC302107_06080 [Pectobacterium carotovorum subsp. carotovorum]
MKYSRIATAKLAWRTLISLIYLFLLAPIIVVLIISFDTRQYLSFPPESFSFGSYIKVFNNAEFIAAFWRSLAIGIVVGMIAVISGILLSLALTRFRFRRRQTITFLVAAPFLVPHIVLAVGLMLVFAPLGLLDSYGGIILAHLGITIPYTVRTIAMSLSAVSLRRIYRLAVIFLR